VVRILESSGRTIEDQAVVKRDYLSLVVPIGKAR
jgi:hypothetical protein